MFGVLVSFEEADHLGNQTIWSYLVSLELVSDSMTKRIEHSVRSELVNDAKII